MALDRTSSSGDASPEKSDVAPREAEVGSRGAGEGPFTRRDDKASVLAAIAAEREAERKDKAPDQGGAHKPIDRPPLFRQEDAEHAAGRPEPRLAARDDTRPLRRDDKEYVRNYEEKAPGADRAKPDLPGRDEGDSTRPLRRDDKEFVRAAAAQEKADETGRSEADDSPPAIREARDRPKEYASGRAAELQSMLPEARRGRITMGVGVGTDTEGGTRVVIGTSEDNGYMRKPIQPKEGEEVAEGKGHAETSILDYMDGRGIRPSHVAAGRPICPPCADRVDAAGADPASPLKTAKEDRR